MHTKLAKSAVFLSAMALAGAVGASGVITCETPTATGIVLLVENGPLPEDDVALARIEDGFPLGIAKVGSPGPGANLFDCVLGPIPPAPMLSASGSPTAPEAPAYVEHGLKADSVWAGIALDLILDNAATALDVSVLAVDFDTAAALSEQFRLSVVRAADGSNPQLMLTLGGEPPTEIGRLPLDPAGQRVTVTWPTAAAAGQSFVVTAGGVSIAGGVSAESRPRALRLGYLAINPPAAATGALFLRNPELIVE